MPTEQRKKNVINPSWEDLLNNRKQQAKKAHWGKIKKYHGYDGWENKETDDNAETFSTLIFILKFYS